MRNTAIISEKSERYAEWVKVFGTSEVPIINIFVPNKANVLGEVRDVYMLDLKALNKTQRYRLCTHLADKFGFHFNEVEATIDEIGVPLLAEDLIITTDQMFFL